MPDNADEDYAFERSLRLAGLAGASAAELAAASDVGVEVAEAMLSRLVHEGRALRVGRPEGFVDASLASGVVARVAGRLAASERESPWLAGMTALALARDIGVAEPVLARILSAAVEDGRVAYRAGYYATSRFVPELTSGQRAFFDRAFTVDASTPYVPVAYDALTVAMRAAKVPGIAQAFETLLASSELVRVDDAVYRGAQIVEIRIKLEAALRHDERMTMATFRDLIGMSRKYAVPLLEWFDATGVTVRAGDTRELRAESPERTTRIAL